MSLHTRACGLIAAVVLFGCTSVVGAQEAVQCEEPVRAPALEQSSAEDDFVAQTAQEATLEWLWGEATLVDTAAGTVTVKYLDYDTDTEKETVITVDEKTTFENAQSIAGIAVGDDLSIDYAPVGKSLRARNISVEKALAEEKVAEETPAPPVQAEKVEPETAAVPDVQETGTLPEMSTIPTE